MNVNALANGLGAQSMELMLMACRGEIPATISITADTGWEYDRLWSTGRRSSSREYYDEVVVPLGKKHAIETRFVRTVDGEGKELPGLRDLVREVAKSGDFTRLNIPMFGSRDGQVMQRCTDKMKIRAMRQELRRMGATTARIAQGIHIGEAARRVKGTFVGMDGRWSIYQTVLDLRKTVDGQKVKVRVPIKWLTHYYPLVDLRINRSHCQRSVLADGIPYLLSSECDGCPWKDLPRWERTSPEVLAELVETEAMFKGEFFFTDKRIPLPEALAQMRKDRDENPPLFTDPDFGCGNAECGI